MRSCQVQHADPPPHDHTHGPCGRCCEYSRRCSLLAAWSRRCAARMRAAQAVAVGGSFEQRWHPGRAARCSVPSSASRRCRTALHCRNPSPRRTAARDATDAVNVNSQVGEEDGAGEADTTGNESVPLSFDNDPFRYCAACHTPRLAQQPATETQRCIAATAARIDVSTALHSPMHGMPSDGIGLARSGFGSQS